MFVHFGTHFLQGVHQVFGLGFQVFFGTGFENVFEGLRFILNFFLEVGWGFIAGIFEGFFGRKYKGIGLIFGLDFGLFLGIFGGMSFGFGLHSFDFIFA